MGVVVGVVRSGELSTVSGKWVWSGVWVGQRIKLSAVSGKWVWLWVWSGVWVGQRI
jgi:hypothetical protein